MRAIIVLASGVLLASAGCAPTAEVGSPRMAAERIGIDPTCPPGSWDPTCREAGAFGISGGIGLSMGPTASGLATFPGELGTPRLNRPDEAEPGLGEDMAAE